MMAAIDLSRQQHATGFRKPFGTATESVKELLTPNFEQCGSPSLRLEKFVVLESEGSKLDEIRRICKCLSGPAVKTPSFRPSSIPGARAIFMKLQSRLLINQAGGVLENTGLCLHPHFGCPMIPGSAVKGIARATAIQEIRDTRSPDEKTRLLVEAALTFGWCGPDWTGASDFHYAAEGEARAQIWNNAARVLLDIAPSPKRRIDEQKPWKSLPDFGGMASFLPAYPMPGSKITVTPDVVNCHHPEYYRGNRKTADDTENPVPNFFPAVEAGLSFEFAVVPIQTTRLARIASRIPVFSPIESALRWLETGLSTHGAGAKTNAGYGWFERDSEAERLLQEKLIQQEEEKRKITLKMEAERLELERKNSLSPERRAAEDYEQSLPPADIRGRTKGDMATIDSLPEEKQRGLCSFLALAEKGMEIWNEEAQEAAKYRGPADEKKYGKARKRINKARETAQRLGVELP